MYIEWLSFGFGGRQYWALRLYKWEMGMIPWYIWVGFGVGMNLILENLGHSDHRVNNELGRMCCPTYHAAWLEG